MAHISDIKLIRTDTTLDLSQKAEKGMICTEIGFTFYFLALLPAPLSYTMWDSAGLRPTRAEAHLCISIFTRCYCHDTLILITSKVNYNGRQQESIGSPHSEYTIGT